MIFLFSAFARRASMLLFGLLLASQLRAQDSTLTRLLSQNHYALAPSGHTFTGPGWNQLKQAVSQSRYVLLGEDHGTAEIPQFTAALAQVFQPTVFVAEIDPYETQDLTRLADQAEGPAAFLRQYPLSLSFYSRVEEFKLIQALRRQHVRLLGLDQVNCLYAGRFYTRLAEQATNPADRAVLRRRAAHIQAHDRAVMGPDPSQLYLLRQSAASLDSLRALTRSAGPVVQEMVQAYGTSAIIYRHAIDPAQGLRGHEERVAYLRRGLLQAQGRQAAGSTPLPKTLFKFGALHVARGSSPLAGVFDLGNLALNLAQVQGQQSLHVLVAGRQGTKNIGFYPGNAPQNVQTYSNADEDFVKPFFALSAGNSWQVFDLRPLRTALVNGRFWTSSQALYTILSGYDFVVIIPETTAAHNY